LRPTGRLWAGLSLWGPVAAYLAAITALSHQSSLTIPGGTDWLWHGIEYAGLGALVGRAVQPGRRGARVLLVAAAGCAAFGALDEFHQSFVPGRHSSAMDAMADTVGATLALTATGLIHFRRRSRPRTVSEIEITLYGRRDCHLCDDAERIVDQVAGGYPVRIRKIDIDTDPELGRLYSEQVPVILVNGRKVAKLHVDPGRLRRRIVSLLEGSSS
jgi:VanZ family protein/glutaredoxin